MRDESDLTPLEVLRSVFGYPTFRPHQQQIREFVDALAASSGARVARHGAHGHRDARGARGHRGALGLHDPLRVVASFDRPNLRFGVERPRGRAERDRMLVRWCRQRADASGIVMPLAVTPGSAAFSSISSR